MWDTNDYSLRRHNTFGLDVRCMRFAEYGSVEELRGLLAELRECPVRRLLHIGGELRTNIYSCVGSLAQQALSGLFFDKGFISGNHFTLERLLYSARHYQASDIHLIAGLPPAWRVNGEIMLAEAEGPEFHTVAFDATYSWEMHHLTVDIAQGRVVSPAAALRDRLSHEAWEYAPAALRMRFTSNHDENSWNGSEFVRYGAAVRQMAALTFLLPGVPLIYNGQEAGSNRQLPFFEKDCVDWQGLNGEWTALYGELISLKHAHPALWGGTDGGDLYAMDNSLSDKVLTLKRKVGNDVVMGLFNLSGEHVDFSVGDEDFEGVFAQIGSPEMATLHRDANFYLPPWGWFVYYK